MEAGVVLGARDGDVFDSYQLSPYTGYRKTSGSWEVIVTMTGAGDDRLTRGQLGRVTEVAQVRQFGSDSTQAEREFEAQSIRVQQTFGEFSRCAEYQLADSRELRHEWTHKGRQLAVVHNRGPSGALVAVQWGGRERPAEAVAGACPAR